MKIAIDGYSACGKSSFAKRISREYRMLYIDSGAMYRAVTLYALRKGFISGEEIDRKTLIKYLDFAEVTFEGKDDKGFPLVYLNGRDVEQEIRSMEVSARVSDISKIREVRERMVELQRELGRNRDVVMDGRDIGTVVFPDAEIKIFMTAEMEVRAERRYKELLEKGMDADMKAILKNLRERDFKDETRKESPLKRAQDAYILDNSYLTMEEQMEWFTGIFNSRRK